MALCDAFPNLFAVVAHKDALIKEMWGPDEGGGCWNPLFLRSFNDWELEEVNNFLTCLSRTKVQPSLEDKVRWVEEKNGLFSVKSMFKVLDVVTHCYLPINIIWQPKIQSRICFFGRQHGERPQLLTIFRREEDLWLIDAFCAKEKKKQ